MTWHIITGEYPPTIGGVSDYSQLVAEGLADAGDEVHVWCPPLPHLSASNGVTVHPTLGRLSWRDLRAVDRCSIASRRHDVCSSSGCRTASGIDR